LLTPTEPATAQSASTPSLPPIRYYQLTHDYLVPSLRAWLTNKQKLTLSGRAELRLTERAKLWGAHPEGRQLPSAWEWLAIRCLTRSANWTAPQRQMMRSALRRQGGFAISLAVVLLAFLIVGAEATSIAKESLVWFRVNTAPAWLALGREQAILSLLKDDPDPTLRTRLIHRLRSLFVDPKDLMAKQAEQDDVSIRRALLLAAGESVQASTQSNPSVAGNRRENALQDFIRQLVELYQNDIDPGIHAAAEWTLARLDQQEEMVRVGNVLQANGRQGDRQWYLSPHGHTMVVVPGPVQYLMGSPEDEPGRRHDERLHAVHIRNSFLIASRETTVDQFQRYLRDNPGQKSMESVSIESIGSPQTMVSWYQAAAYCNWLSKEEGIPESQWCYRPNTDGQYGSGMTIASDSGELRGYRLPTEKEWEYACRAGATTIRFFGRTEAFAAQYAVYSSGRVQQPLGTGLCKPNDFGLFDMLGNVSEWCQDSYRDDLRTSLNSPHVDDEDEIVSDQLRVARGASFQDAVERLRCAARSQHAASSMLHSVGFRVARNYP
jgi:formylglycine-generating enzyme required for sulfatase activity